jgi:hydroxylamine dehydrogenase
MAPRQSRPPFTTLSMSVLTVVAFAATEAAGGPLFYSTLSEQSSACNGCHREATPAILQQWGASTHFRGNVGCFECHGSQANSSGAFEHNGYLIHTIVTPADYARCHPTESVQFAASRHARAAEILGSLDNTLAEVVEGNTKLFGGSALLANGCQQCHGGVVKVDAKGRPTAASWPNTGMGRINLDGSRGSCCACHQRHAFSVAQARYPATCGRCHLGRDHPQKEIYEESKHGISFAANAGRINIDNPRWVVGEDYGVGPTCATCHMSATPDQPVTHNVGDRISWNNRPKISIRADVADAKLGIPNPIPWEKRRGAMKDVCSNCHASGFADSFYSQVDGLKKAHLVNGEPFANEIDWTWLELWHHEGRRARHGASMQGPDYTHWHGLYEVAKAFYTEFIPEAQELVAKGIAAGGEQAESARAVGALIDSVLASDDHKWFIGKMSPEEKAARAKQREEFSTRYLAPAK